jgi:hypothetical protein
MHVLTTAPPPPAPLSRCRLCSKARVEAAAWADEARVAHAGGQCLVAELAGLEMLYERASGHELYNLELSRKQVRGGWPLMTSDNLR